MSLSRGRRWFALAWRVAAALLLDRGQTHEDDLAELKATIKEGMPEWLEAMESHEDLAVDFW